MEISSCSASGEASVGASSEKRRSYISNERGPVRRTIPRTAAPGGELTATIVSSTFMKRTGQDRLGSTLSSAFFQRASAVADLGLKAGRPWEIALPFSSTVQNKNVPVATAF